MSGGKIKGEDVRREEERSVREKGDDQKDDKLIV